MINKNLLIELVAMMSLFIGFDTFIYIKKGNIDLIMAMIFLECLVIALLALCVIVDKRDKRYQR